MKKRILGLFITVATLLLGLSVFFAACDGEDEEKAEYVVTVLSPDEEPLSGVTVTWLSGSQAAGSARTGDDGKAKASLPLGSYSVVLSDYYEGYSYTASASVNASMRNITLTFSAIRVKYTVSVTDKTGSPAEGVVVTWTKGDSVAGSAKTNENGVAVCELDYGEYFVTLSNLPADNIYESALTVNGNDSFASFELRQGKNVNYAVTVKSEGGLLFKDQSVQIYNENVLLSSGKTDDSGVYSFAAIEGHYTAKISSLPDGYTADTATLSPLVLSAEVILHSSVITTPPAQNVTYVMGDIIHDYTFRTPYELNGEVWESSVAEILKTKEALILNNWGTNCSWCVKEMPAMQEVYEKYGDKIEMVAVSNYPSPSDADSTIVSYYQSNGYTFPMMRDTNGFAQKFGITGWPTTIVIDRYGAVARIESGAISSAETWERLILKYIGDGYMQTFTPGDKVSDSINTEVAKPDVEISEDHYEKIAEAMNDTNNFPVGASVVWYGETEYEMAWPFVLGVESDISSDTVMYSSNTGKANSMSIIYATVTVGKGKVFVFDYYAQTEEGEDVLSIIWDGKIVKTISGSSDGWKTCYLYADLTDGSHTLSLAYVKDGSGNVGKDNVFIKGVRFADLEDIQESTDMLRGAAYGTPDEGATEFPYYADAALGEDGYYHVDLSSLQNPDLAGRDQSPLLLVNLLNATQWSPYSINTFVHAKREETGEYLIDCNFTVNGTTRDYRPVLVEYLTAASASDIAYCIPVNQELHGILVEFMKKVSGNTTNENEWLEACYFYSHYGDGEFVGNPILGLMEQTAIPVKAEEKVTANLTRNQYPFPSMIYTFTPETSAVYKIESFIPESLSATKAAQIWIYDDETSAGEPLAYCGDTRVTRDGKNEHNFEVYRYMTAGHKYYLAVAYQMADSGTYEFTVKNVGQSATEMIPCSEDTYEMVLDDQGEFTGKIVLAGAIGYVKDEDGYYHAKNPDGTMGDFIYLDVKYASTTALGTIPISRLVDKEVPDPVDGRIGLGYKFFNFRYRVTYISASTEEGDVVNYNPQTDFSSLDAKYRDYTETVRGWIDSAPTDGEYEGLVKVDQEIVDILTLYIEMRVNAMVDEKMDTVLENEWLKFCWYKRTYDSNNA